MTDQDPGQGAATPGILPRTPINDVPPPDLLDDATTTAHQTTDAIHNAFLMGWSLQELKSRMLLGAFSLQPPASSSNPTNKTGSATNSSVTPPSHLPFSKVDTLLQGLLQFALPAISQVQGLPGELNKSLARTSEWRAIFIRIATVHNQCFPASTTENTTYDPCPASPSESRFPYLYPSTSPNYALIGISSVGSVGMGDLDERLGNFKLYDVTRRALNCLTLLYTRPEENLLPDIISNYQNQIVQSIFQQVQVSGSVTPAASGNVLDQDATVVTVQQGLDQEVAAVLQAFLDETSTEPSRDAIDSAIKVLSFLTVRFLDSWDGYLRENFYAGGLLKNNELELLAYEAGHSLASLSWEISLATSPLESALEQDPGSAQLLAQLSTAWMKVFNSPSFNSVQRQVSALGPALDDAYYVLKKVVQPTANEQPGLDLPGRAIHALTYSLSYWQRAIEWICQHPPPGSAVTTSTVAALESTTTSATTISTPQESTRVSTTSAVAAMESTTTSTSMSASSPGGAALSPVLTLEVSRQLRQALVNQAGIWQSLMLGEQTLRSFATGSVTKRILNNIMAEFENNARKEVLTSSEDTLKQFRTPIIVGGILLVIILGGGFALLAFTGQLQSLAAVIALLIGSALTLVSTVLTRVGSIFSPTSSKPSSATSNAANTTDLGQRLGSVWGMTGEAIVTAFQNAYKQIQLEFDDLNHYVAISYPLIDFFTTMSPQIGEEINDGYIFLTKIVWTSDEQRDEIERVARAAFGPLGALIGSPSSFFSSMNSSSATSNATSVAGHAPGGKSSTGLAANR